MRKGGERRLRHDVSAKTTSVSQAESVRAIAEDRDILGRAASLIFAIKIKGKQAKLTDELISEIAHKAVRDAQKQIKDIGL